MSQNETEAKDEHEKINDQFAKIARNEKANISRPPSLQNIGHQQHRASTRHIG